MTDLDPMDARLREYADRWRASSAPAPALDTDRLTGRSRARTWWAAGIAAAAVVAGIAVGTTLIGDDGNRQPPEPADTAKPTATAKPSEVLVPWADLAPTYPQIPTTTTSPSPDPAEAAGKPECRASDLSAAGRPGVAAGTYYLTVRLTLVGDQPCRLEGYPDLVPLDAGHPVAIPLEHRADSSVYGHPVLVAAGRPALLRLGWSSGWCAAPVHNDTIRMLLPGGGSLSFQGLGGSQCYGTPGSGTKAPIEVGTFEPVTWHEGRAASAYAALDVGGDLDLTASSGQVASFTVTLTSRTDLTLDPCPDYQVILAGDDQPVRDVHALNCAAVPFKDDRGRPYLPAGTPVQFAMHATVGSVGVHKLSWVLDTVDQRGVSGSLTVTPGATAEPSLSPQQQASVHDGVLAIQTFLDTWRRDGMVVAARRYFDAASPPQSGAGLPRISSGKVLHADVSSWESPDHFVLEVQLDLHFTANRLVWDEGRNDRFVTVTRDGAGFRLDFATSP